MPNYFLCFFADFFFSSRTSLWTRFNIGCAHIVRSIMPFEGWATRFLTLDFLGAIFFWYFSLRKIFRRKQKFCWVQICSICCSCSWRPWRLKRKIWRPSRGSLHPYFGLIVCMFVYPCVSTEDPEEQKCSFLLNPKILSFTRKKRKKGKSWGTPSYNCFE